MSKVTHFCQNWRIFKEKYQDWSTLANFLDWHTYLAQIIEGRICYIVIKGGKKLLFSCFCLKISWKLCKWGVVSCSCLTYSLSLGTDLFYLFKMCLRLVSLILWEPVFIKRRLRVWQPFWIWDGDIVTTQFFIYTAL